MKKRKLPNCWDLKAQVNQLEKLWVCLNMELIWKLVKEIFITWQHLGSDFVHQIFSQFSHDRNWHKNDQSQKLSNLQNFNSWMIKLTKAPANGYFCISFQDYCNCSAFGSSHFWENWERVLNTKSQLWWWHLHLDPHHEVGPIQ